jgi:hypothetical protein
MNLIILIIFILVLFQKKYEQFSSKKKDIENIKKELNKINYKDINKMDENEKRKHKKKFHKNMTYKDYKDWLLLFNDDEYKDLPKIHQENYILAKNNALCTTSIPKINYHNEYLTSSNKFTTNYVDNIDKLYDNITNFELDFKDSNYTKIMASNYDLYNNFMAPKNIKSPKKINIDKNNEFDPYELNYFLLNKKI